MDKNLPKWPDSLPPPVSIGKGVRHHCVSPDEFGDQKELLNLLHDMYWFSDDLYFMFTKEGKGLGAEFSKRIEVVGIEVIKIENYFYPHPSPGHKNDYVHLPPGEIKYDWHREASEKQMYTRFTLQLTPWKRKELDMAYSAEATSRALAKEEPVIEAKPGIAGFSINLIAAWRKVRAKWLG